jgi:rifampin ADP-ribosylating transferase
MTRLIRIGDHIEIGLSSNFGQKKSAKYIYLKATLDAAVWGAESNPTMSYRSKHPFKVVGEVAIWQGHSSEQVKAMKDALAKLNEKGIEAIGD